MELPIDQCTGESVLGDFATTIVFSELTWTLEVIYSYTLDIVFITIDTVFVKHYLISNVNSLWCRLARPALRRNQQKEIGARFKS